jgi:hypothetical protein
MLQLFRHEYNNTPGPHWDRNRKVQTFLQTIPILLQFNIKDAPVQLPTLAQYKKSFREERFLKFAMAGRACSICLKNEFSEKDNLDWTCCPNCQFGWCCTKDHWNQYRDKHTREICNTYRASVAFRQFHHQHMARHNEVFLNLPEFPLASTLPAFSQTWDEYFALRFADKGNYRAMRAVLPPFFNPASTTLRARSRCFKRRVGEYLARWPTI